MKQYLDLIANVLQNGHERTDRTGTGTLSVFGTQSRYNLMDGFPLCTTKKVNFKPLVNELLWMLRGQTNIHDLDAKIWDEWADEDGGLGPIYGFQWRHWGGRHNAPHGYIGGIDQIQEAIDTIKQNPTCRRIIVNAWNPSDIDDMALPPCHMMFQFYVRNGYLDCQMYQRSADLALGVPFNIASYALLMTLIAHECELQPGELVHTIGDCHIYLNHVEGMREQLKRTPTKLPSLSFVSDGSVLKMKYSDFTLTGYDPQPAIKFEISV